MHCMFRKTKHAGDAAPRAVASARSWLFGLCLGWSAVYATDAPLALDETIRRSEELSPMLAARRAAVAAAELESSPAGELPDPELLVGVDNLPVTGSDAGSVTADFMTMRRVGVMQAFPRRAKRDARVERAQATVAREAALRDVERLGVREAAARAWILVWRAERQVALMQSLKTRADAQVNAADANLAAGRASAADAIAAREQRSALDDRLTEAERDVIAARAGLARWLPDDAALPLADPPDFRTLGRDPQTILAAIDRHRGLLTFDAETRLAEAELALARADKRPDWALEVSFADRGPAFSDMVSVMARIDLPVFSRRRQDPVIAARQASLERVEAEREAARREHAAELRAALAAWQAARARVERSERELLPLAEARGDAALAGYRGGRGTLAESLSAQSDLIELHLASATRLAELGEAWVSLRYAFLEEH